MGNFFDQRYYRLNKLYMSQYGIWPEQSLTVRCLMPIITVLIIMTVMIPDIIRMRDVWEDMDRVIEGIPTLLTIVVSFTKLFNGSINVGKMRKVINRISRDWEHLEGTKGVEVLHTYAARGRVITVVYTGFSSLIFIFHKAIFMRKLTYLLWLPGMLFTGFTGLFTGCAVYIYGSMSLFLIVPVMPSILDVIMPLNESRPKKALYESEYGVDPDDYFFEILFHAYLTTIVTIGILVTVDSMYFVNVQHACALFKVVGVNLKLSLEDKYSNDDEHFKTIRYCINLHKDALSFADLLESSYSTCFAIVIFIYLVIMSISGVLVVTKLGQIDDMIRFGTFTIAVAISLFLNSIPGQNLIDHSLDIHTVAYEFEWYKMSSKLQKLMMPMMLKSMHPCVLTAGKIYIISMENYCSVMQSAMSYFTVLSSMR